MFGAVNGNILFLRAHQTRMFSARKLGTLLRGLVQACNSYTESMYRTLQNCWESCRYAVPRPKPKKRYTHWTMLGNIHTLSLSIGSSVPVDPPKADVLPVLEELEACIHGGSLNPVELSDPRWPFTWWRWGHPLRFPM